MKDPYDFEGPFDVRPWGISNDRHRWDYHGKYATCVKCGITVKAYRAKASKRLPKCNKCLVNNSFSTEDIKYKEKIIYYNNILSQKSIILNHDPETEAILSKALSFMEGLR